VTKKFLEFFGDDMSADHKKEFIRAFSSGEGLATRKAVYDFAANRSIVLTPAVEDAIV